MGNESIRHCSFCGWPEAEAYELVSQHETSEGLVVYTRCPCGRVQLRRGSASAPVVSSRAAEAPERFTAPSRSSHLFDIVALLLSVVLVAAVAATLPGAALLACLGLAVVIGALAWAWSWLTSSGSWDVQLRFTLRAALLGGAAGIALTSFAATFGPATVVVLPVLYAVVAAVCWLARAPRGRAC